MNIQNIDIDFLKDWFNNIQMFDIHFNTCHIVEQ